MPFKFISLKKAVRVPYKYTAVVENKTTGRYNTIHFGNRNYEDYTMHKDDGRKRSYIARHKTRENWGINGANTAGFWSKHLLWNKKTIAASLSEIKNKLK